MNNIRSYILSILIVWTGMVYANQMALEYSSSAGGYVTAEVDAENDSIYILSAYPAAGYQFLYWLDGETVNPRRVQHTFQEIDWDFTAVFAYTDDIINDRGQIRVSVEDPTIPSFSLSAEASECGTFLGWNTGSTVNPLIYQELDGTRFASYRMLRPERVTIEYHPSVGGAVFGAPSATSCSDFNCAAIPTKGYEFLYWLDKVNTNARVYTYDGGDITLTAVFAVSNDIHAGGGNVHVTTADPSIPSFTLEVQPGACSAFNAWNDASTTNPLIYNMYDGKGNPVTRKPIYDFQDAIYTEEHEQGGYIQVTPLECGYTLTAKPSTGFHFTHWNDGSTNPIWDVDYAEADYTAYFSDDDQDIIITEPVTMGNPGYVPNNLIIKSGGDLTLTEPMTVKNLYLEAKTGQSAQLHNPSNLTYDDVYIDITLEPKKMAAEENKYYAFSLPFEVDVNAGVARQSGEGSPLENQMDYWVWEYDGQMRADNKENGWVKKFSGTLLPGRFYMLRITGHENVWRFHKKAGAPLMGNAIASLYKYDSNYRNRGWNAMGNSLLYYVDAYVDGIKYAQVYDNNSASGKYNVRKLNMTSFVVACPFFIQTQGDNTLHLGPASHGALYAPSRMSDDGEVCFEVTLSSETAQDNLFVTASETAINAYQIGPDLIKMKGGQNDAYIWANGYGYELAAQELPWNVNEAIFDITCYSPQSTQYQLLASSADNATLYLLENGQIIWDLSSSPYNLYLPKGNSTQYSLLIRREGNSTPSHISESWAQEGDVVKFIKNEKLYIRINNQLYDARGAKL